MKVGSVATTLMLPAEKLEDMGLTMEDGADEIDRVIDRGVFSRVKYRAVLDSIAAM